jgi:hypothetical protein
MDVTGLAVCAAELRETVNGDGVDLRLVGISERERRVELELGLADAGCADCVLPPDALQAMVASALQRSHPGDYTVVVHDPRTAAAPWAPHEPSGTAVIVSPAASVAAGDDSPGPDAGRLEGLTVGFRIDRLWRSWDWVADQWAGALGEAGVTVAIWRRFQGLDGAEGDAHEHEFAEFLGGIDVAIVGLGNCGSCTSWTIKDAIAALEAGRPTIAVTTAHFEKLGRTLAAQYGRPALRLHVLPYPLDTRAEGDVRQIADEAFAPMLATLGARV